MVLICLFAFVNLLNTCIPNTVIRRHDYALLEAAGMTKVQIYQTQNAEILIYFLGSLIGSCVVGIPLGFFLCNEIAEIPGLSYGNTAQKSKHDTARHDIIKIWINR